LQGRHPHLPYRRENPDLKSSAILADEFHHNATELAKYGRVLVLLDACHLGGVTGDGSALTSNADLLRSIIAASNVTVLTSRIRWRDHRKCDLNAGHAGRTASGAFHAPIIRIPMTSDPWAHPIPTPRAN
jgi:hypothetical protein